MHRSLVRLQAVWSRSSRHLHHAPDTSEPHRRTAQPFARGSHAPHRRLCAHCSRSPLTAFGKAVTTFDRDYSAARPGLASFRNMVLQPTDLNATARKAVLKLAATSVAPIDTAATAPDGFSLGSARNPTADSRWNGLPRFSWEILASLSGKPENPVLHSGLCCQQRSAVTWRQMASQRSRDRESPFEAVLRYTSL
jgi:hypothetical protein